MLMSVSAAFQHSVRLRHAVLAASVALIGLLVIRLACVDGLMRRVTIDGPSMAPEFCGTHFQMRCVDCKFAFSCDAEHLPADRRFACPNCGFTDNALGEAVYAPPQRVLIDRWALALHRIRRGDIVAFREPGG